MKLDRQTLLRSSVIAILCAGVSTSACGANSPDVPSDDGGGGGGGVSGTGQGGTPATGGAFTGGTPATGGAFPTGGTPATGGAFPTGGTPATGGAFPTGGTGTTMCGSTTAATGDTSIDDLEDGENAIKMPRVGYWYTYNDGTCSPAQMPAPDPSGATPFAPTMASGNGMFAAHTAGGSCGTWGAGMGFDLANCNMQSGAYNAGVFSGISFWYKSGTALRVIVATTDVIPNTRPPGTCVPGGTGMECDNGHGMDLAAAPAGMTITVPFTMLSQSFGQMKPFDKTKIVNIQWQVANGAAFDFAIDDVAFTP